MDKIRLALTLITIAILAGPTIGVLIANQNNLLGLIIPPELEQITNNLFNSGNTNQPEPTGPPDVQYDLASRTVTISFQLKSPFPIDVTLDSMSGPVECNEHNYVLGTASLKNPVKMTAGQTATVTVLGTFTQDGVNHLQTAHQGETSAGISLVGATIKAGGMTIQMTEPMSIGEVPLT